MGVAKERAIDICTGVAICEHLLDEEGRWLLYLGCYGWTAMRRGRKGAIVLLMLCVDCYYAREDVAIVFGMVLVE